MMMSGGGREGNEGAASIRDSSLPGISPLQINTNVHTHAHVDECEEWWGQPRLRGFAIPQEQAGRQIDT